LGVLQGGFGMGIGIGMQVGVVGWYNKDNREQMAIDHFDAFRLESKQN